MPTADSLPVPGRVLISDDALAQLARAAALDVYGVVGTSARGSAGYAPDVASLLGRVSGSGVVVTRLEPGGLKLDLHGILRRGLNLAAVAESLRTQVGYQLELLAGQRVAEVVVHIDRVADVHGRRRRSRKAAAATAILSRRLGRILVARESRARAGRVSRGSTRSR